MRVRPSEPCELRKVCCGRRLRWQEEEGAPSGVRPPSEGRDGDRQNTTASCSLPPSTPFFSCLAPFPPNPLCYMLSAAAAVSATVGGVLLADWGGRRVCLESRGAGMARVEEKWGVWKRARREEEEGGL